MTTTIKLPNTFIKDRISVVMPCFNTERYLKSSIDSVLKQAYPNIELIVIDDGSTDNSKEILKQYGNQITTLFQDNQGPGPARNRGIEVATGEFIAFLDSDDYWDSRCLALLYAALKNSDAVLSYCGWQNVGGAANKCQPYIPPDYEHNDKVEQFLKTAAPWPIHAALVRHDILLKVGAFDEQWSTCMDYDLWLRIGTQWPIKLVEEVLAFYRHHSSGQITSKQWRQAMNVLQVKLNYIKTHPTLIQHLSEQRLKELTTEAYLKRGYDAYWKRDLVSAHRIFRVCLKHGYYKVSDFKYLLPAILPEVLFKQLVGLMDKSLLAQLKHFIVGQKCIPWAVSNKFELWLERIVYFKSPVLYQWLKFKRIKTIVHPLTEGPNHHFFGYYDKTPWSKSGDKILTHEASFNNRPPCAEDIIKVGFVMASHPDAFIAIAETKAWNWQQGAMLQWHPIAPDSKILFNNCKEGQFIGVCHDLENNIQIFYERPIYAISPKGDCAFSLNFARLFDKRPGYGYAGSQDSFADQQHPTDDGIFSIDMVTGKSSLIISLDQLAQINPLPLMANTYHWVNHIQISPNAERLAFFHIWQVGEGIWSVRLYTAKLDGSDLDCLLDTGDISHYDWKDDHSILVWAKHPLKKEHHFLLCDVDTKTIDIVGEKSLKEDGHCSFSPDRKWILNDTYPDRHNLRTLMLVRNLDGKRIDLQNFYSPKEKWWGEIRCDLHPRWNREGNKICIDSVHNGTRQMYVIDLEGII